jgi:hypothetical protein
MASRGVGGMNGRVIARARTAGGKMKGKFLERRANDLRFRCSFSSCHRDMFVLVPEQVCREVSKIFLHRSPIEHWYCLCIEQ